MFNSWNMKHSSASGELIIFNQDFWSLSLNFEKFILFRTDNRCEYVLIFLNDSISLDLTADSLIVAFNSSNAARGDTSSHLATRSSVLTSKGMFCDLKTSFEVIED